jgi:hypothetical protein
MTPFEKIVEVLKAQTSEMEAEGRALRQFLRTSGSPEWVDLQKAGEAGTVECDHLVLIAAAVAGTAGMRFLMHWLQQRPLNEESARCILSTLQDGAQQCAKFSKPSKSEGIRILGQMVMDPTVTSEIRCEAITTACWLAPAMVGHGLLEWIGCQDLSVKEAALEALETWAEILLRDPSFWGGLQKAGEAGTVECDDLVLIAAAITGTAGMRFLMHWLQQRPLNEESARCILGTLQDGAQQCAKFSKSSQSEGIKVLGQMVMDPTVTSEIRCEAITTACWLAPAMVGHRLLEWIGCQDLAVKKAALEALGTRAEILIRDPSFRRLFEEVRVDQVPSSTGGFEWGLPTDNSGELEALILATKHEDGEIRRLGSLALAELRALDTQHHRTH